MIRRDRRLFEGKITVSSVFTQLDWDDSQVVCP